MVHSIGTHSVANSLYIHATLIFISYIRVVSDFVINSIDSVFVGSEVQM